MSHVEECVNSVRRIKEAIDHPVKGRQNLDKYCREFGYGPGGGDRRAWLDRRLGGEIFAAVCRDADEQEAELKAIREATDGRRRAAETRALRAEWEGRELSKIRRQITARRATRYHS